MSIASHWFTNVSVYETEGKAKTGLYDNFQFSTPKVEQVVRPTYFDVLKLLTKRGETKAELSTYYMSFRCYSKLFEDLLLRLRILEFEVNDEVKEIIGIVKKGWLVAAENSEITDEYIIEKDKLEKYTNYDLDLAIIIHHTLDKDATLSKEIMEGINITLSTRTSDNNTSTPKVNALSKALQYVGITSNIEVRVIDEH